MSSDTDPFERDPNFDRPDSDTHDQLFIEMIEYFKANEAFYKRKSIPKRRAVRKRLANIMKLAKIRREEIIDSHRDKIERTRIAKQKQDKGEDV